MSRRPAALSLSLAVFGSLAIAAWWWQTPPAPQEDPVADLPLPPFPPRITEGENYESCLAALAGDPAGAMAVADAWLAKDGGDGAVHCQGLALIATGKPEAGAATLEHLAETSEAPPMARAQVLGQAGQARLMVTQPATALDDASRALALSPADADLFIMRATAEGMLDRFRDAIADLDNALRLDASRADARVARAVAHRQLNELDLAQADVGEVLGRDPDNPDALLERGILRQRMGDQAGARTDWQHARDLDPNSTTADLAEQNLSLLEAGPERH